MIIYTKFWIFATVLIFLPQINSYGSSYLNYARFYTPPPPPSHSQHRDDWREPECLYDYHDYFSDNDSPTFTSSSNAKTNHEYQFDDDDDFSSYPGQGYMNQNSNGYRSSNRARQISQTEVQASNTENMKSPHEGDAMRRSFQPSQQQKESHQQVNYNNPSHYPTQYTYAHIPVQQNTNTYPNRAHIYPWLFQSSETNPATNAREPSGLVFKVQRNPEGKLNVVFNDTINVSRDSEDYSLPTNPSRRSTSKVDTTVRPTQATRRQGGGGGDIIFPDDLERNRLIKPQCSKSDDYFCTEVKNYPTAQVQAAIRAEFDKYENLFGDDVVIPVSPNITQRIDVPGEESLCPSVEKLIYPQAGLTKDNSWNFIVNQENFTQGIRIEECLNAGKPCSMADLFPNGYTTECRQSYIYRQLLSVNPEGKVIKDLFRLPSCCKCIIKSSHRFRRATTKHANN